MHQRARSFRRARRSRVRGNGQTPGGQAPGRQAGRLRLARSLTRAHTAHVRAPVHAHDQSRERPSFPRDYPTATRNIETRDAQERRRTTAAAATATSLPPSFSLPSFRATLSFCFSSLSRLKSEDTRRVEDTRSASRCHR